MKCPVSMLPTGGSSTGAILFVIGVLAIVRYALQAKNTPKAAVPASGQAAQK